MLTYEEATLIRANLFYGAHYIVDELPTNLWHRDKSRSVTAQRTHSSQALAFDVFATVERLTSRAAIIDAWADHLKLPQFVSGRIALEYQVPTALLGEPRSSQIDALIRGESASALVECKFTEPDGGSCSQVVARVGPTGSRQAQCNGNYEMQTNPLTLAEAFCALSAKRIRYWEFIPTVLGISSERPHSPCPFAGGDYQWMRNLVSAHAFALARQQPFAFIVAYADGPFPMRNKLRSKSWNDFQSGLSGSVELRTISFQQLLAVAQTAVSRTEVSILRALVTWVDGKVRSTAS